MSRASYRYRRGDNAEQDDIACAVATSLTSLELNASAAKENWIPKSEKDMKIYRHQRAVEDSLQADSSSKNETEWSFSEKLQNTASPQTQVNHTNSSQHSGTSTPTGLDSQPPITTLTADVPYSPRQTIDDRIKEMMQGNPVDLPWIDDHAGDTWIFIDPATQQPEQTEPMYQAYVARYSKPLIMKSTILRSLQSPIFDKMFEPSYQYRMVRRRQLKGKLPGQIKFVDRKSVV